MHNTDWSKESLGNYIISLETSGFSLGRLHMGGGFVPPYGGTSAGAQSVNGGTHEGGHRAYGGLTLIDYIIN